MSNEINENEDFIKLGSQSIAAKLSAIDKMYNDGIIEKDAWESGRNSIFKEEYSIKGE
jgi:hypothetical protein